MEGLLLLLRRIRLVAERNAATPAERLLDDALRLLDLSAGLPDRREYEEVSGLLSRSSAYMSAALHRHCCLWRRSVCDQKSCSIQ